MIKDEIQIGASEVGAILGVDPFKSPMQLYASKLGVGKDDDDEGDAAFIGRHVEHALATMFEEEYEVPLKRHDSIFFISKPWMRATPDRVLFYDDMSTAFRRAWDVEPGECMPVEMKTAGLASKRPGYMLEAEWGADMSDRVPAKYAIQSQMQSEGLSEFLEDIGAGFSRRTIVYALLPGGHHTFVVHRKDEIVKATLAKVEAFIDNNLVPEIPPPAVDADDWATYIEARRVKMKAKTIATASPEDIDLIDNYRNAKAFLKEAETSTAAYKARIIDRIGDGYGIEGPFGRVLYTAGKESPRLRKAGFVDDVLTTLNLEANSEDRGRRNLALALLGKVKQHTKTVITNRQLRGNFNDGDDVAEEQGTK